MQLFRFDSEVGREIQQFKSRNFTMSRVLIGEDFGDLHIGCAHLGPMGKIGLHQAVSKQLLLVVQGEGWVSGEDSEKIPITSGQGAFWTEGEWHETSTQSGLMAIIIEGDALKPELFMPQLSI